MNSKNKVVLYAIIVAVILYVMDAMIYYLIFNDEDTFMQVLITAVPLFEVYNRLLLIFGVIIFGLIASGLISDLSLENEFLKHQPGSSSSPSKMDTSFVSSLSHQIRTPLNAIVGFSELLKDPNLSAQSKQTYISHIHSSGNYLIQFINNLVDITKIESNELEINKSDFDIKEVLTNLMVLFNEKKKELGKQDIELKLETSIAAKSLRINTDKQRLEQVLSNLLENAFKHTEEGSVEIGYRLKKDDLLEFYIKDTGLGFSMDRLEIIFNRYKKLSDNHNQPFDGVALRLTISKSLVKLLGGEIWADSKIGKGSVFYFTFPFNVIEQSKEVEPDKAEIIIDPVVTQKSKSEKSDFSQFTILIAEDVESNFIYLQELLRPTHATLIWAQNGAEAVKEVETNAKIDLVLMDILMPEMDGYEASKRIKELRNNLPVIAQTAYSLESGRNKNDLISFDDYLIKPIWSPQLLSSISKYLKVGS
ncbi:MAG: response regulator [Bacteroidales bacterium]|nr:response regulator [Bacteroidales bacterium]